MSKWPFRPPFTSVMSWQLWQVSLVTLAHSWWHATSWDLGHTSDHASVCTREIDVHFNTGIRSITTIINDRFITGCYPRSHCAQCRNCMFHVWLPLLVTHSVPPVSTWCRDLEMFTKYISITLVQALFEFYAKVCLSKSLYVKILFVIFCIK